MSEVIGTRITAREREVLTLIATGMSAKQVSRELAISPRTVECHVERIRQKTGTRNRVQLIARAAQAGIIDLV